MPNAALDPAWTSLDFDDSGWRSGAGGLGFELGWDYLEFIDVNLLSAMWGTNASCLVRMPFQIDDPDSVGRLTLGLRFDDGFVAYINGRRVAEQGAPTEPTWNASATHAHEAHEQLTVFDLSDAITALTRGENLLAIHGMNASATSPDFLIDAELRGEAGAAPVAGLYSDPLTLTKSGWIKARLFQDQRTSALNEALYAVGPVKASLRISEIMYHPPNARDEFIELTNIGAETINLNLVRFTDGIAYRFGDTDLQPGAYLLLVNDVDRFTASAGPDIAILGPYTGNLSNSSERVELVDALGATVLDFRYDDRWHAGTDGDGLSLEVVDASHTDPERFSEKETWRPSLETGGTPGR